uniref:Dehydrogenase/reductase (SDR family) member 13a, duplicate 3 n=1 Tax=Amphiprion ocellaris TaxID=80972 RepID=A0AAQ5ZHH1_AMPOC
MSVLLVLVAGAVSFYVIVYYSVFRGAKCLSSVKLQGKTAIVTGSNTGIGKATALDLAKRGARVILACRSKERAEAAAFDIRRESGNSQVVFMQLDLASLKSVRSFAKTFLKTEPRLDILINNAGVMGPGRTEEGFSMAFGVNHLGHFLLTNLLLERLQQCGPSRVVTVTGLLYRFGNIDFPLLASKKDLVPGQFTWHKFQAYCHSKLCNVLFTRELANRLQGTKVTCYTLHPGVIYTDLCRNLSLWLQLLMMPFAKLFFLDPEGGAQTTLHCALQEGIEPLSGRYYSNCVLQQVGAKGRDDALAKKLWEYLDTIYAWSAPPSGNTHNVPDNTTLWDEAGVPCLHSQINTAHLQ